MKLKLAKYFCLLSIIFFFNSSLVSAQDMDLKFNFDDEYQGEGYSEDKESLIHDPFESVNRKIFSFNEMADKTLFEPVVKKYVQYVPKWIRNPIHNFTTNISAPFSTINSIFQGDGENAMASFSSFLINSTLGIGGLFDVANSKKIQYREEDFGQTFGKYGVGSGPYLVIPFLGPSDLRDFSGFTVKQLVSPLALNAFEIGGRGDLIDDDIAIYLTVTNIIDTRASLISVIDSVRKNSFDVYATMRSAFLQRRNSLILNQ
ncbi:MAG: phospholipid-binding lipoprotein MlaA [Rickettsiales bacterium]|jgi:phospholipid-binding lipoprotein MlaA